MRKQWPGLLQRHLLLLDRQLPKLRWARLLQGHLLLLKCQLPQLQQSNLSHGYRTTTLWMGALHLAAHYRRS